MEEREISIKEIFSVLWKGKYLIAIAAVAVALVTFIGSLVYENSTSEVSTIVSLQWNGIGAGEMPDGTRFDYQAMMEPSIVAAAIDDSGLVLLQSDVRAAVTINPIIPNNVASLVQTALERGEEMTYYATDYKFILDAGSLNLTVSEGSDLLYSIIGAYRDNFERMYINQALILDYTSTEYDSLDYIDAYEVLAAQIDLIDSMISAKSEQNSNFVSTELGITFNDILVRTELIKTIELDQISSRVNTYLLTKDENYLITKYTYQIQLAELDLAKATAKETDAQTLLNAYTGSVTTILVPGLDPTQVIEMDTYYDTLAANLIDLQGQIADLESDIDYYQLQIDRLDGTDTTMSLTPTREAEEIAKVDATIALADTKLQSVVADANIILVEYNNYITSNVIKPLMVPQEESNVSILLFTGIGFILGAGVAAVVVLFKHNWE